MKRKRIKLSLYEMRASLPKIETCISQLNNIDISKIKKGNESFLLFASQKMETLLASLFGTDSHQYNEYDKYSDIEVINLNKYEITQVREWVIEKIERAIVTLNLIKEGFQEELEHNNSLSKEEQVLRIYQGLELHPVIASATGKLFNNGHYVNAVEDAVKALNNLVRLHTGLLDDGVSLMQDTLRKGFSW